MDKCFVVLCLSPISKLDCAASLTDFAVVSLDQAINGISSLVAEGVGEGVGVGVAVGVGEGVGVGVGVGVATGTGFFTATPLFQINFLPDLTQVYLIPADVLVRPTFLHVVPGLTAAVAIGPSNDTVRVTVSNTR